MKIRMQSLLLLRRWLLQNLIPEWFWPEIVFIHEVGIKIRNTPYTFGSRWLLKKGLYEKEEAELILSVLKRGMTVIEMGGSIGILTAIMAQRIGTNGKVLSIEASKKLCEYSRSWLEKSGNVHVINGYGFPVWDAPSIKITKFDEITGNLGGTASFDILEQKKDAHSASDIYDIKRICTEYHIHPDIIVIDIEGSEILMAKQTLFNTLSLSFTIGIMQTEKVMNSK
jgi:FkbM family methyltransferase